MTITLPILSKGSALCNSWVLTSPNGSKVFETFDKNTALRHLSCGWNCKTAFQHLAELNKEPGAWGSNWKTSKA